MGESVLILSPCLRADNNNNNNGGWGSNNNNNNNNGGGGGNNNNNNNNNGGGGNNNNNNNNNGRHLLGDITNNNYATGGRTVTNNNDGSSGAPITNTNCGGTITNSGGTAALCEMSEFLLPAVLASSVLLYLLLLCWCCFLCISNMVLCVFLKAALLMLPVNPSLLHLKRAAANSRSLICFCVVVCRRQVKRSSCATAGELLTIANSREREWV